MSDDQLEEKIEEQGEGEASNEPLEVKVIKEKEKTVNEELDYEDMEILDTDVKEFEDGN